MSSKSKDLEGLIEESIDNVRNDRAMASTLLVELMKILNNGADASKHQYTGPVAAKYLETLQRSNEQLVKITNLLVKKNSGNTGLSKEDKDDIYDLIKGENQEE